MKKIIFIALACIVMCSAACSGFEPKKVKLTDKLTCYTLLDEITGDTLTGVLAQDRIALISPLPHTTFSIEQKHQAFLIATDTKNNTKHYYTLSGKLISYEPMEELKSIPGDTLVFLGEIYEKNILYFPSKEEIYETPELLQDHPNGYIAFHTADGVRFVTLKGTPATWTLAPGTSFYFVFGETSSYVALPNEIDVVIYKPNGKKIKKIPLSQWEQILKHTVKFPAFDKGTTVWLEKGSDL